MIESFGTLVLSLFVGNVFNLFLYGALTVQLYLYYINFPEDRWLVKTVVYLVYLTETVNTVFLTYDFGKYITVPGYDTVSPIFIPVCGGIVGFLAQAMYTYRIWALGKLKHIAWCITVLIALGLVSLVVLAPLVSSIDYLILGWASVSLAVDFIIAGAMVWSLRQAEVLSKRLESRITRLVHLIIGTGALTAAINLVTVISFATKEAYTFYAPAIILSKIYANSMMVFLNDRATFRGRDGHAMSDVVIVSLGSLRFATPIAPSDTAQEQSASEGCDDARSSIA